MQNGVNAFDACAIGGHLAVAEYLAPKMEGHLFDSDDVGNTALHWAAQEGQLSMVEYLVRSCGFDVKARDKVGQHFSYALLSTNLEKSFSFLFPLFLLLNLMMFCVDFSFVSFLNRYCQFQLLLHGLFPSVQCMLGICQFSTPSCVELDVLTLFISRNYERNSLHPHHFLCSGATLHCCEQHRKAMQR